MFMGIIYIYKYIIIDEFTSVQDRENAIGMNTLYYAKMYFFCIIIIIIIMMMISFSINVSMHNINANNNKVLLDGII